MPWHVSFSSNLYRPNQPSWAVYSPFSHPRMRLSPPLLPPVSFSVSVSLPGTRMGSSSVLFSCGWSLVSCGWSLVSFGCFLVFVVPLPALAEGDTWDILSTFCDSSSHMISTSRFLVRISYFLKACDKTGLPLKHTYSVWTTYKLFVESVAIPDLASRRPYAVVSEHSEDATYRAWGMLSPVLPRSQQIVLFFVGKTIYNVQLRVYGSWWPQFSVQFTGQTGHFDSTVNTWPCLLTWSASVPGCHSRLPCLSSAGRSIARESSLLRSTAIIRYTYDFKQKHRRVSMETILSTKTWIIRKILSTRSAIWLNIETPVRIS